MEHAVGQAFARAFLSVVWPDENGQAPRGWREELYRKQLGKDLAGVTTSRRKDELTFGLFSLFDGDLVLRGALKRFAESAYEDQMTVANAPRGTSNFSPLWAFGSLYEVVCHRFYFVPIHQQLVESFFSKFDTCVRKTDRQVMDPVRVGQFRSSESRHMQKSGATGAEIRDAGKRALAGASLAIAESYAQVPAARAQRKRVLDEEGGAAVVEELKVSATRRPRVCAGES